MEVVKKMKKDNPNEVDWAETEVRKFHPTNMGLFKGMPNMTDTESVHNFLYNGMGKTDDQVFNVELNEIKQLVIKFGDGITTQKLTPNSELHIFYLETQGMDGGVLPSSEQLQFLHGKSMFGIQDDGLYDKLFPNAE